MHLSFEDNQTAHGDLVLTLPDGEHRCDSYYFLVDGNLDRDEESPAKVKRVLVRLLKQWKTAVDSATDDGVVFLPYEFADEYTGWIRCKFSGPVAMLVRGWSDLGAMFPTEVEKWMISLADFSPADDAEPFMMDRESILTAIGANIREYEGDIV